MAAVRAADSGRPDHRAKSTGKAAMQACPHPVRPEGWAVGPRQAIPQGVWEGHPWDSGSCRIPQLETTDRTHKGDQTIELLARRSDSEAIAQQVQPWPLGGDPARLHPVGAVSAAIEGRLAGLQ